MITFLIILSTPLILFLFNKKTTIISPKKITVLFSIFILLSTISLILSSNIQKSFEFLTFYLASFIAFIFSYNFKNELKKGFLYLTFGISVLFTLYSLLVFLVPALTPHDLFHQFVYQSF